MPNWPGWRRIPNSNHSSHSVPPMVGEKTNKRETLTTWTVQRYRLTKCLRLNFRTMEHALPAPISPPHYSRPIYSTSSCPGHHHIWVWMNNYKAYRKAKHTVWWAWASTRSRLDKDVGIISPEFLNNFD